MSMYHNSKSKGFLTRADVQNLRREYEDYKPSLSTLANKYGISKQAVHKIIRRDTYKDVPDLPVTKTSYVPGVGFDALTIDGKLTIEGEVYNGELAAVLVLELVQGTEDMYLQVKSGTAETQKPMGKELQVMMLRMALEMLEGEEDK